MAKKERKEKLPNKEEGEKTKVDAPTEETPTPKKEEEPKPVGAY